MKETKLSLNTKNNADQDSRYKKLALSSKQNQCMKLGLKLYD